MSVAIPSINQNRQTNVSGASKNRHERIVTFPTSWNVCIFANHLKTVAKSRGTRYIYWFWAANWIVCDSCVLPPLSVRFYSYIRPELLNAALWHIKNEHWPRNHRPGHNLNIPERGGNWAGRSVWEAGSIAIRSIWANCLSICFCIFFRFFFFVASCSLANWPWMMRFLDHVRSICQGD